MVASVNFGQVNTINGKTVLTGSQSGIDTNALITALTTAKSQPAVLNQSKISANQTKIIALNSLKTMLGNLKTSVDALRNPSFGSGGANAFAARSPFLTVTNGKTVSDYVGVSTDSGAPIGKYTLTVDKLATAETMQSTTFSSRTASAVNAAGTNTQGAFAAGTFKINGVDVTIKQGDNLNNIAAAINSTSASSNVTASVVQLSSTDFRLVINGKNTGAANAITITDPSGVFPSTPNDPLILVKTPADDSQITFNGETVTRPSNQISDLLDHVTFSLYGKTNAETVTLDIDKDNSSIASAVGNFIDAYNTIRTFQAQQNARDATGALMPGAVLANDTTLNTVMNQLSSLIAGQASIAVPNLYSSGTSTAPKRMGDLGISLSNTPAGTDASGNATPEVDNILTVDTAKLNSNIESFFDDVENIFQFNFVSSSPTIGIYKRTNTVTNTNFNIVVDTSQPIGSQAKIVNIDGSDLAGNIALNYKTTTTSQSSAFNDSTVSSAVNGSGTDTAGAFAAGTFQINGTSVTLTQGMTLTDVMNTINSANTGVKASILKNSATDYRLVLNGTADGTSGVNFTDPSHVLPSTGLFSTTRSSSMISGQSDTDLAGFSASYSGSGNETISRSSNITSKDFTLSVDSSQVAGEQAKVTSIFGAALVTPIYLDYETKGGSTTIIGNAGTPFAGLEMIYTGNGTDTSTINMQQGIADKLYNSLDGLVNGTSNDDGSVTTTGVIDEAVKTLNDSNTKLQTEITTINTQVSTYRDQLLTKFAALESAISASNRLLQLLSAQDNAALVSSGH